MLDPALYLDPDTDDLAITPGGGLALGRPDTSIASIVVESARGELKETPLIGGDAVRQLGSPRQGLWLIRLRKMLRAAGLNAENVAADKDTGAIRMTLK